MVRQATPRFSIVVPTYDRAHLLPRTLASALAQEDGDFEILVVDDGSRDDTEGVVHAMRDERLVYYRKDNAERGAARNYGAARARGAYINFLDSDDRLYPNHLSIARHLIERHAEPEIIHLGYEVRDASDDLIRRVDRLSGDLSKQLLGGNLLSCNGVFLRRDVARAFPFNEKLFGSEDWELWLRLGSRYRIRYSNVVTSVIVDHDERSCLLDVTEEAFARRKELLLEGLFGDETFVRRFGRYRSVVESELLSYGALHLAMSGAARPALRYLRGSLLARPTSMFSRRFLATIKRMILA